MKTEKVEKDYLTSQLKNTVKILMIIKWFIIQP